MCNCQQQKINELEQKNQELFERNVKLEESVGQRKLAIIYLAVGSVLWLVGGMFFAVKMYANL